MTTLLEAASPLGLMLFIKLEGKVKMVIDKLIEKIKTMSNPTVVGLDPTINMIPEFLKKESAETFGDTVEAVCDVFLKFNKTIIDNIFDIVPCVKPQIAMYEQYGSLGLQCYIDTINYAKSKNMLVIGDVKRGDIASTAGAYSSGHLGQVTLIQKQETILDQDFITINPYLGYDSIEPYLDNMKKFGKGVFVLVKTSNAGSIDIQDLQLENGTAIYEKVGKYVSEWGESLIGKHGFSSVGAVVGATHKNHAKKLREIMPHTFFLVPGYGAQGAGVDDLSPCFINGAGAIVNSSRGIIFAYKDNKYKNDFSAKEFAGASRQACLDMREDLNSIC